VNAYRREGDRVCATATHRSGTRLTTAPIDDCEVSVPLSRHSHSPSRLLLTGSAAVLLLSGCTDDSGQQALDLEGLSSGPCADVVTTLEDVDESLRAVAEEDLAPEQAAERFRAAQDALQPAAEEVDGSVRPAITELVTRLGFFRISVDSNNYDQADVADVRAALTALVEDCRAT
jgi:hypothetical protein